MKSKLYLFALLFVASIIFTACDNDEPVSVTLNKSTLTLAIGETATLVATITPASADQSVVWISSDNSVVIVDSSTGVVTAISEGTATITVVTADGGRTATCIVNVYDRYKDCPEIGELWRRLFENFEEIDLDANGCVILEQWRNVNLQRFEQERQRIDPETGEQFWQETESGLLFRVINPGIGDGTFESRPSIQSSVQIRYEMTYFAGIRIDGSQNMVARVSLFIPGFQEALLLMQRNAIFQIIIPYNLAYGAQGLSGIPPYSALLSEIELINFWTN